MISNEKWKEIEEKLKAYYLIDVKFKLGDDVISIERRRISESKTVLAVFINGEICHAWAVKDHESFNPVSHTVWRKIFKPFYSKQKLAAAKKKLGVRSFNRLFSKEEQTGGHTYFAPYFPSSRMLISQFKKIEGIEYLEGDKQ